MALCVIQYHTPPGVALDRNRQKLESFRTSSSSSFWLANDLKVLPLLALWQLDLGTHGSEYVERAVAFVDTSENLNCCCVQNVHLVGIVT